MAGKSWCISVLPFFLCFPSSPASSHSIRAAPSPMSPGKQGECGVFTGSKIYEQLKSRATPGIHQPGHTATSRGGGGRRHGKTQAIYFYIRFLFKEGRLWQNYVLPLWDCWFLMKHPQWGQSTWKGIKCVVCLHGDVSDLFKSINKIMTKKKNQPPALHYRRTSDLITLLFITAKL